MLRERASLSAASMFLGCNKVAAGSSRMMDPGYC